MSELSKKFQLKWTQLRAKTSDNTHEIAIAAAEEELNVWLSLTDGGARRLLVGLDEQEAPPASQLGNDSAVTIQLETFSIKGNNQRVVELRCEQAELEDLFEQFIIHLIGHRRTLPGAAAVDRTIQEFVDLLGMTGGRKHARNLGNVGELYILRWLLDYNPGALEQWTGPAQGRHDFRSGRKALEVKTGLRPHSSVEISSLEQLEPVQKDGDLWLAVVTLEADPEGKITVRKLAQSVLKSLPTGAPAQPEAIEKLKQMAKSGEENSYSLFGLRVYRIDESTPRLRVAAAAEFPASVSKVKYSLNLDHLSDWKLTDDALDNLWKDFR
ncbi:PD-(D/E)XK motif protein [Lujinxingia vulgaris]|nr:PD-(D/E)XK motif protein [Lujinxingia vulgaris]